jgi:hypothetical protein
MSTKRHDTPLVVAAPAILIDNVAAADRLGLLRMQFSVTRDLFTEREMKRLEFVKRHRARYHEWEG